MSRDARKPVIMVFDQAKHKPAFAAKEDGSKLEISHLRRREIVLINRVAKTKVLISYGKADLRLCFCIGKNPVFS